MEELQELKKLTQDIIKLSKKISYEHVKPLQEKLDNLSVITDKALQRWAKTNTEINNLREAINEVGKILKE